MIGKILDDYIPSVWFKKSHALSKRDVKPDETSPHEKLACTCQNPVKLIVDEAVEIR